MPTEFLISTILITLALIFYTIGVWADRLAGRLKPWRLIFFSGGLIYDTSGTGIMMDMAGGLTFHRFSVVIWLICWRPTSPATSYPYS
jgi:hypothetical protein